MHGPKVWDGICMYIEDIVFGSVCVRETCKVPKFVPTFAGNLIILHRQIVSSPYLLDSYLRQKSICCSSWAQGRGPSDFIGSLYPPLLGTRSSCIVRLFLSSDRFISYYTTLLPPTKNYLLQLMNSIYSASNKGLKACTHLCQDLIILFALSDRFISCKYFLTNSTSSNNQPRLSVFIDRVNLKLISISKYQRAENQVS